MTMMSNLPRDLVEEILSRLPLKSMRSLRLTCKNWNALSKSRSFTKLHIAKAASARKEGEFEMIAIKGNSFYLMSIVINGIDGDPSIEPISKLTCLDEQVKIFRVFHCEGLLLCILRDNSGLVVLNPYLGQTKWIERQTNWIKTEYYSYEQERYRYAIGYVNMKNNSSRSHKILKFIDNEYKSGGRSAWYQIYDLDSGLWRTLDVTPRWPNIASGVSVNGNTYWCALEHDGLYHNDLYHINFFDFTRERFGSLLMEPFSAWDLNFESLSSVKEEKLAALFMHETLIEIDYEIWISTKIVDEKVSWSKFLTVYKQPDVDNGLTICNGIFLVDEEKKVAVGVGYHNTVIIMGEAGYIRKVVLGAESTYLPQVCSYVPSLVQIKQSQGGKRKKTEKRRYGE